METTQILPVLDLTVLQEKANEYAMKGAMESLKEFYSGYSSPYRKAIEESLKGKGLSRSIEIPDIVALLNATISAEVDAIANSAIAQTFIPLVKKFFTRQESEMQFSAFLKEIVEITDGKDIDEYEIFIKKDERFGWLSIDMTANGESYQMTLHETYESRKDPVKKYSFLGLPNDKNAYKHSMKLTVDNTTLELPFTKDVLANKVVSYVAQLVISKTNFTMDTNEFHEEMFPERCHCD